jgi:sulfatase modifying factor 1
VSGFRLDKYDVTVGRFRQFVNAWDGGTGYTPTVGSGKHSHVNGGQGLANSGSPGTYEPGWVASNVVQIDPTNANLTCNSKYATWTSSAGSNESLPINCINWYEAYAFCIWDGGFLPSEAEWEYAAAGGNQQREYPWGSTDPGRDNQYAIYGYGDPSLGSFRPDDAGCYYPSAVECTGIANIAPVGTATQGAGLWGQLDLAGEVNQWDLDWYNAYFDPCIDCAYLLPGSGRMTRGSNFDSQTIWLELGSDARNSESDTTRDITVGLRCARSP